MGKENSVLVSEGGGDSGKPLYSEEEMKQMVENAEKEIAECQLRVSSSVILYFAPGTDMLLLCTVYSGARDAETAI